MTCDWGTAAANINCRWQNKSVCVVGRRGEKNGAKANTEDDNVKLRELLKKGCIHDMALSRM